MYIFALFYVQKAEFMIAKKNHLRIPKLIFMTVSKLIMTFERSGHVCNSRAKRQIFDDEPLCFVLPPFGNDNPNGSKLSKIAPIKNLIFPY